RGGRDRGRAFGKISRQHSWHGPGGSGAAFHRREGSVYRPVEVSRAVRSGRVGGGSSSDGRGSAARDGGRAQRGFERARVEKPAVVVHLWGPGPEYSSASARVHGCARQFPQD